MRELDWLEPLDSASFARLMAPFALPEVVGVGVSGGGDSLALLALASDWATESGRSVVGLTVDHGLRPESGREAAWVAARCRARGVRYLCLRIVEPPPDAGLQAWARRRRLALMRRWARENGNAPVLLAHALEDQAETVLMRLMRGAGTGGLAAMRRDRVHHGLRVVRPLLGVSRRRLRATLRARGEEWLEDPANRQSRFERVRVRETMGRLGIDAAALARTAAAMADAQDALEAEARRRFVACARQGGLGEVEVGIADLGRLEEEFRLRVLRLVIAAATGAPRPAVRRRQLVALQAWIGQGDGAATTLGGCIFRRRAGRRLCACREAAACAVTGSLQPGAPQPWDRRWRVWQRLWDEVEVSALGLAGAGACKSDSPRWRRAPLEARAASPAFRREGRILAVPAALHPAGDAGRALGARWTADAGAPAGIGDALPQLARHIDKGGGCRELG